MPCELHILNADGRLTGWMPRIRAAFESSLDCVAAVLPVGDVDVIVYDDPDYVLPELGMSGFCTSPRRMYLPLDSAHPELTHAFERVFQAFFAHEMHHCARRSIEGFAATLGQALVTEGLACCFEAELPGGSVPVYATRVRGDALERVRVRARAGLDERLAGWGEWFFGTREPDVPLHAGYALGYDIVSTWLERNRTSAAAAFAVPAADILAGGRRRNR